MVCKIVFSSEFPDIPENAGRKTRRRRRRTQAIAKRYAFHANAKRRLVKEQMIHKENRKIIIVVIIHYSYSW